MTALHHPTTIPPILSVDLGRTSTKACIQRDPEHVVLIPPNVAQVSVEQVRREGFESNPNAPLMDMWLEYQGKGYAVGQLASDFGADLGLKQSKVENALVKVLACVGYFGLQGDLMMVLNLPYQSQEQFERDKELLSGQLLSPHNFLYRGGNSLVTVRRLWIVPEGYGSLIWSEAQESEDAEPVFADVSVAVVDIGHQTTDFLMIDRFRFARGASKSEPFAMNRFYEQIAAQIPGADNQSLLLIEAVHRPSGKRFYRPRGALQPTNLDEILPHVRKNFAQELMDRLFAWLPERATDVIVSGGGGEFLWPDLQALLREAQLSPHLAKPSRLANALGQYLYAEVQLANDQP